MSCLAWTRSQAIIGRLIGDFSLWQLLSSNAFILSTFLSLVGGRSCPVAPGASPAGRRGIPPQPNPAGS